VTDGHVVLEIYDSEGRLVRSVVMTRDERDPSKWHLAEHVALGGPHAETAVIRFRDGTSAPLPQSTFSRSVPINTIFL
jgi:hypothetical protein